VLLLSVSGGSGMSCTYVLRAYSIIKIPEPRYEAREVDAFTSYDLNDSSCYGAEGE